jgi:hypothetical protein
LERLNRGGGGVLAVIAPQQRLHLLWHELRSRCERASFEVSEPQAVREGLLTNRVEPGGRMMMVSWPLLLGTIEAALKDAAEERLLGDLRQLQGLAAQADADAFLPLESAELTGAAGARVIQFVGLVKDAFAGLEADGLALKAGQQWTNGVGDHGQYFLLHGIQARLMVQLKLWGKHAFTPIWLRVGSSSYDDRVTGEISKALMPWRANDKTLIEANKNFLIPIELPTGVEREHVVTAIIEQVKAFAQLLGGVTVSAVESVEAPVGDLPEQEWPDSEGLES